jgi:hypothetical protein
MSSSLPEFIVISPAMPVTLCPHSSASLQVVFRPDAAKSFSGSIVLNTSRKGNSAQLISVTGTGTTSSSASSTPAQSYLLSASASSLNFGNIPVRSSAFQAITLTNTGTASVSLSQVAIAGTDSPSAASPVP